jgi:hypothetical protein
MERSEILAMIKALQLTGMRAAYDEIVTPQSSDNRGSSASSARF